MSIVVARIFESVPVADQAINPALAVLRLAHRYSPPRVDRAAALALEAGVHSPRYAHLHPILASGRDQTTTQELAGNGEDPDVGFVRGASYYAKEER
jgi:hypothetical protein